MREEEFNELLVTYFLSKLLVLFC